MQTPSLIPRLAGIAALAFVASGCAGSEVQAAGAQRAASTAHSGTIEGGIAHPDHATPAMRICAIGSGESTPRACVQTQRAQNHYRIEGLPPDDYLVIAAAQSDLYRVGGHVQQVQCIRAPCPEMPATVTVAAGATVSGVDINGFYDQRDDFPSIAPK